MEIYEIVGSIFLLIGIVLAIGKYQFNSEK